MTQIYNSIIIRKPAADVFEYVSTPAHWPDWHPASLRVHGNIDASVSAGVKFEEDVFTGGRRGHLCWTVLECNRPGLWSAEARAHNGATLSLSYRVYPHGQGSFLEREVTYELPNVWLRLLNRLILRRRFENESGQSLNRLKATLEGRVRT